MADPFGQMLIIGVAIGAIGMYWYNLRNPTQVVNMGFAKRTKCLKGDTDACIDYQLHYDGQSSLFASPK